MFKTKYIDKLVNEFKPTDLGWLWSEEDNYFLWFQETMPYYIEAYKTYGKQFKVAIQAGGHLGLYPRMIATVYETVYTFEPDTESFHCLVNNCQTMNIKKFNAALGDKHEMLYQSIKAGFNVGVNRFTSNDQPVTTYVDNGNRIETALVNVPQIRIDDLGLADCDLIHLDVEESEGSVITGAFETITKFKPLLVMETVPTEHLEWLDSLGYQRVDTPYCGDAFYAC